MQNLNDASQEHLIPSTRKGRLHEPQNLVDTHVSLQILPASTRKPIEIESHRQKPQGEEQRKNDDNTKISEVSLSSRKCITLAAWAPEMLSLLLAISSLVATFIILSRFNRVQQPDWSFSSTVNLSTIIALLAATTQSMLRLVIEAGMFRAVLPR